MKWITSSSKSDINQLQAADWLNGHSPQNDAIQEVGRRSNADISLPASFAGWVLFEVTDEVEICVDHSAILKNDQVTTLEYLLNLGKPQLSKGMRSAVNVAGFDCEQNHKSTLIMTNYFESMGQGCVLFKSDEPTKWRP